MRWIRLLRALCLAAAVAAPPFLAPGAGAGAAAPLPAPEAHCVSTDHGILWYCPPPSRHPPLSSPTPQCRVVSTVARNPELYYCKPGLLTPGRMAVAGILVCAAGAHGCRSYALRAGTSVLPLAAAPGAIAGLRAGDAVEVLGSWHVSGGHIGVDVERVLLLWATSVPPTGTHVRRLPA